MTIPFDMLCTCGHHESKHRSFWRVLLSSCPMDDGLCRCKKFRRDNLAFLENLYSKKNER